MKTIEKNITIWKTLNMLGANDWIDSCPINEGKGLSNDYNRSFFWEEDIYDCSKYTYYHNSWNWLMPAILKIKGKTEISTFDSAYEDLVSFCVEKTKFLPKTSWFLENKNKEYIAKNYQEFYDIKKANESDRILTTKNLSHALSFGMKIEADKYLAHSFQARHINNNYKNDCSFEPVEHVI